ncbi:MAG: hypothetical protein ACOYB7_14365 [Mycobacterium sp.]
MTEETTLYRAFDKAGQLLYVGISHNPFLRLGRHADHSAWSADATTITLERFNSRAEATDAELAAIRDEDPVFNFSGRPQLRWSQWAIAYPAGKHADDITEAEVEDALRKAVAQIERVRSDYDAKTGGAA